MGGDEAAGGAGEGGAEEGEAGAGGGVEGADEGPGEGQADPGCSGSHESCILEPIERPIEAVMVQFAGEDEDEDEDEKPALSPHRPMQNISIIAHRPAKPRSCGLLFSSAAPTWNTCFICIHTYSAYSPSVFSFLFFFQGQLSAAVMGLCSQLPLAPST